MRKQSMWKNLLGGIMAGAMVLSSAPVGVLAAEDDETRNIEETEASFDLTSEERNDEDAIIVESDYDEIEENLANQVNEDSDYSLENLIEESALNSDEEQTYYDVTWDANGGVIIDYEYDNDTGEWLPVSTAVTREPEGALNRYLWDQSVQREGYKLVGWKVGNNGPILTNEYDKETEDINYRGYNVNSDITFYAQWTKAYTVKWNPNGGSFLDWRYDEETQTDYQIISEDTERMTLNAEGTLEQYYYENDIQRDGYKLTGWKVGDSGPVLSTEYNEETDEPAYWGYIVNSDITLYAQWAKAYTVKWDPNGGSFLDWRYDEETQTDYQIISEDTERTTLNAEGALEQYLYEGGMQRDGYKFVGWRVENNGPILTNEYDEETDEPNYRSYNVNSDITLYAQWAKAVTVIWDANGGKIWNSYGPMSRFSTK